MLTRPAQAAVSRHGATSAVLELLKEESDVFEDDAPLNFLKPSATATSLPKGSSLPPDAHIAPSHSSTDHAKRAVHVSGLALMQVV